MKSFELTVEAQLDVFEVFDYLADKNLKAAIRWHASLLDTFEHLARWPRSGLVKLEYGPDYLRFWIHDEYLVIYDPDADPLRIIGVLNGAQDLIPLISRRIASYESETGGSED